MKLWARLGHLFLFKIMVCVAYLIDTIACDTAGTQKQLLETIRLLDRTKFEPLLICLWQSEWMTENELPCHCIILEYKGFLKLGFPKVVRRLIHTVDEQQIRIIQTFFEDSIFVAFLSSFLAKSSVVLLSSRRDMGLGKVNRPWYHLLYGFALPWVNRFFAGIVANSEQVRQFVAKKEKTDLTKIKVIRNGVYVPEKPDESPALFQQFSDTVWIGLVASLTPVKRHDLLLLAAAILSLEDLKFRILFLGDGPRREELETFATELGMREKVHFLGAVTNVPSYLFSLDIGVLCSDREGLSNAILEYMACGLPVVATAVGGNTELIDDGNGICVPPDNPTALAEALRRMIVDKKLREQCGLNSLDKIKQNYSWTKAMTELQNYYQDILARSS